MRLDRFPRRLGCAAFIAALVAGCGTSVRTIGSDPQEVATRKALARLKISDSTLSRKELGEVYPEDAWTVVKRPFEPACKLITEADAFEWEYLREMQSRRGEALARARKERLARERKAQAAAEKERKRKAKAEERAQAEAARAEAVKDATLEGAASAPGSGGAPE